MQIHKDSHLDHGLTPEQLAHVLDRFRGRDAFFVETFELPEHLGTVTCALHLDVPEAEVFYEERAPREWLSRLTNRPARQVREVTVVAGPHDGLPCVLFTAYGGPPAPREPGDPGCENKAEAEAFWACAALARTP